MAKKNLILMSLEDSKINKIANVVSNASCKKILDHLAENEATESEISKKLSIPISTVHYNMKQLIDAGLVSADEFHYSEKGKEVNHYKLANKYIIIAPKKTRVSGLKQKLKDILPVGLIALGTAGIIQFATKFMGKQAMSEIAAPMARTFDAAKGNVMEAVAEEAPVMMQTAGEEAARTVSDEAVAIAGHAAQAGNPLWQNIALWFLIGAVFAIGVFIVLGYFRKNKIND